MGLEAVQVGRDIDPAEVLRHDETDPMLAYMLATMEPPTLPVAIGVIYDHPATTLEARLSTQGPRTPAPLTLNDLLRQGPTWRMTG
jgi:2-oxoglutarate ferredoxin oxidoreductase subunit beta